MEFARIVQKFLKYQNLLDCNLASKTLSLQSRNFANINLFSCRHFEISSDLLFSKLSSSGKVIMAIFSCRHNMHLFVMLVYVGALVLIDQVISGARLLSFNFD